MVVGGVILKAKNRFQKGSFGIIVSFPTNFKQYSFEDISKFLLTAVPITLKKINSGVLNTKIKTHYTLPIKT